MLPKRAVAVCTFSALPEMLQYALRFIHINKLCSVWNVHLLLTMSHLGPDGT